MPVCTGCGPVSQQRFGQVVTHLLEELHLFLQVVTETCVCVGRTQCMRLQDDLAQVFLQGHANFHALQGFTLLIQRWHLHILGEPQPGFAT